MNTYESTCHDIKNKKCYKKQANGKLFGACAKLANRLGIDVVIIRLLAIIALLLFPGATIITYLVLSILL